MSIKPDTYEEMVSKHPEMNGVINKKSWDYIAHSDSVTLKKLEKIWCENAAKNISSKRYKRQGGLNEDCFGSGRNKAIVAIGAGKSLNKNKHVLKQIHDFDGTRPWEDRNFIFIVCNHMFKPLLKEGIIPDFVMLTDASDVVMDQLTVDIPESGRNCILIAGLHCSPRVLKKWEKQGRDIRFFLTMNDAVNKVYFDLTKKDPENLTIQQGGNVLNSCFTLGIKFFQSSTFMALGNDLSFEIIEDDLERRKNYYADGDYSTNEATGRDEAAIKDAWMAFKLASTNIISRNATQKYDIELNPIASTPNLWVYKVWLESRLIAWAKQKEPNFNYYNCTEGGILGVLCKTEDKAERDKIENWFLLDEICSKYRTRMFSDAINEFLQAKDFLKWGIRQPLDAQDVIVSAIRN